MRRLLPIPLALLALLALLAVATLPALADEAAPADPAPKIQLEPPIGTHDTVEPPDTVAIYVSRRPIPRVADSQAARRALLPLAEADAAHEAALDAASLWMTDTRSALAASGSAPIDVKALTATLAETSAGSPELRRALSPSKLARLVAEEVAEKDDRSASAIAQARSRALSPIDMQHRAALTELYDVLTAGTGASDLSPVDTLLLASVLVERAEADQARAELRYDKDVEKYERGTLKRLPDPPRKDLVRPVELLSDLLTLDPAFEGADGAWYLLGWCRLDAAATEADVEGGIDALVELVTRFSDSALAQPGGLMLVEELHRGRYWEDAARHAARLADKADLGPYRHLVLLREATARYHLARDPAGYAAALETFGRVLDSAPADAPERADAAVWAAFCLVAMAGEGAEADAHAVASRFFERTEDLAWQHEALAALADLLVRLARFTEAIAVETTLQERWPMHRDNPGRQAHVARLHGMKPVPEPVQAYAASWLLVQEYDVGSAWHEANAGDAAALEAGATHVLEAFTLLALQDALAAQELPVAELQARAIDRLGAWLARYPDRVESPQMRLFRATVLVDTDRLDEAAAECQALLSGEGHAWVDDAKWLLARVRELQQGG